MRAVCHRPPNASPARSAATQTVQSAQDALVLRSASLISKASKSLLCYVAILTNILRNPPICLLPLSVETVGSVYVISCGAPEPCAPGVDPAELLAAVALRCRSALATFSVLGRPVRAQLGLHAGPIVGAAGDPSGGKKLKRRLRLKTCYLLFRALCVEDGGQGGLCIALRMSAVH